MQSTAPTEESPPPGPTEQLALNDAAIADLQLCQLGLTLPWQLLGGTSSDDRPVPGRIAVSLAAKPRLVEPAALPAAVLLLDRESTPLARLTPVELTSGLLHGSITAERAREASWFPELARRPGPPITGELCFAQRPPLVAELSGHGPITVLVPVENATPDGIPPAVLMRAVKAAVEDSGRPYQLISVPFFWRDAVSDAALTQVLLAGYRGQPSAGADLVWAVDYPDWQSISRSLRRGTDLPQGLAESVEKILQSWRPVKAKRGLVLLFSGFSGSGKSTIARDLAQWLQSETLRTITLLDGDDVRRMLSAGLGFDRPARELNVRRIGFVASEIARHGGIAICAPIAPYQEMRAEFRSMVESVGDFVLVHVNTPLAECERRDLKGLYAKARAGVIEEFTGISDPYESPEDADLHIDTSAIPREQALAQVIDYLTHGGWLKTGEPHGY